MQFLKPNAFRNFFFDYIHGVKSTVEYSWDQNMFRVKHVNCNHLELDEKFNKTLHSRYKLVLNALLKVDNDPDLLSLLTMLRPFSRENCPSDLLDDYELCDEKILNNDS